MHKKKHKNTLAQFQMQNCKDLMLPNGSMKSLSIIEKTFSNIIKSIKICLHSFQCEIVTTLCFRKEPYNPYLSEKNLKSNNILLISTRLYPDEIQLRNIPYIFPCCAIPVPSHPLQWTQYLFVWKNHGFFGKIISQWPHLACQLP